MGSDKKECKICGIEKLLIDFYYCKDTCKYRTNCKKCHNKRSLEYALENRDKLNECSREWRKKNIDKSNAICKKYRDNNKEKRNKICRKWAKNNPDRVHAIQRKSDKKIRSTIKGNLNHRMGNSIRIALKLNKRGRHWESLVGYTVQNLKKHLESLFTEGMTWDKLLDGDIHIDHVIPLSFFKFESEKDVEFKMCWRLENLQPLWAEENISKGDRILRI